MFLPIADHGGDVWGRNRAIWFEPFLFVPRGERRRAESSPLAGEMFRLDGHER
jgi:hypothetical protein